MQFAKLTKNFATVISLYCNRAFKGDDVHLWGGCGGGCKPKYYEETKEASAYKMKFCKKMTFFKPCTATERIHVNNISP